MKSIVTIVNEVTITSMPINEFTKFREKHYAETAIVYSLAHTPDDMKERFSSFIFYSFADGWLMYIKMLWKHSDAIFHMHNARSAFLNTLITLFFPKRVKRVFTVHNNFTTFNIANKIMILFNIWIADQVTFVSEASYDSFPRLFKKLWKRKSNFITNGVDLDRVDETINAIKQKKDFKKIQIINIGRLNKQKHQLQLIRVFATLPNEYVLTIIGAGENEEKLRHQANELGVENRVVFTGLIAREEVYQHLVNADLFINTALWEGMPIAVLEAMSCSLPVVLSDIPPHQEIQNHTKNKLICKNDEEYREKILETTADRTKRIKYGKENRKIVEDYYSLKNMHKRYNEIYQALSIET